MLRLPVRRISTILAVNWEALCITWEFGAENIVQTFWDETSESKVPIIAKTYSKECKCTESRSNVHSASGAQLRRGVHNLVELMPGVDR